MGTLYSWSCAVDGLETYYLELTDFYTERLFMVQEAPLFERDQSEEAEFLLTYKKLIKLKGYLILNKISVEFHLIEQFKKFHGWRGSTVLE